MATPWYQKTRFVDLFTMNGGVIASTFRWLIDLGQPIAKRTFMDVYHAAYSTRTTESRSSFGNNVACYTRGKDPVLRVYDGEIIYKKNGKPSIETRWVWENTHRPPSEWTQREERRERRVETVEWIGPSAEAWLASMTPKELDRAYQMLERRLISVDTTPKVIKLRSTYRYFRGQSPGEIVIDELALTTRWLERVSRAIDGAAVS